MSFNPKLVYVDKTEAVEQLKQWLGERRPVLGVDTETTGLQWWNDKLRLVQIGDMHTGWAIPWEDWKGLIKEIFLKYDGQMVMHNHKFDLQFLWANGIEIPRHKLDCTLTMAHLLQSYRAVGLKRLAPMIAPAYAQGEKYLADVMKEGNWNWATVPLEHPAYWGYGALDTVITASLWEMFKPRITADEQLSELYQTEMGSQFAMADMERRGFKVDVEYLGELQTKIAQYVSDVENWAKSEYSVDIRRAAQVINAMQQDGWEPVVLTPTGRPSLSKEALETVTHPLGEALLEMKKQEKIGSTYVKNLLEYADKDGIVHCNMRPLGTITGRMSITDPALQTLPRTKTVRHAFMARPGKKLVLVDYDQMELRIIAHYTKDPILIDACNSEDVHTTTAQQIYRTEDITKEQRQLTKNATYTIAYGGSYDTLAKTAKIAAADARDFMVSYLDTFKGVADLQKAMYNETPYDDAAERYYIRTQAGRIQWAEKNKRYALVNYLIQGTGADVMKEKINEMQFNPTLGDTMLLPVHDEVVFECDEELADEVLAEAIECMTDERYNPVLSVSGDIVDRWGDKYEG